MHALKDYNKFPSEKLPHKFITLLLDLNGACFFWGGGEGGDFFSFIIKYEQCMSKCGGNIQRKLCLVDLMIKKITSMA